MFITDKILDIVVKAKDDSYSSTITAFTSAHAIALGSMSNEIASLKEINSALSEALKYERARADGLVDRLLVRDARVAAVAPSAVAAAQLKDDLAIKQLKVVFDELNSAGVDFPAKEHRAFDMAGGSAVAPRV